ncbi:Oligopeptide transport system permease protein [Staphylococcus petrasii]|nr:Oligopeptide transport system permease protein [Staphylococcus petrasii]
MYHYQKPFKSLYSKWFYRVLFSILSLPIFLYACIKYLFVNDKKTTLGQIHELTELENALEKKYTFLNQPKSKSALQKEARAIYNHRNRYNNQKTTKDFTSFFTDILFGKYPIIKIIFAFPLFIVLSFYLNPIVRYIFERIIMTIVVMVGVVIVVFTILYFSPMDAAYSILGPDATKDQIHQFNEQHHLNSPYLVQLWEAIKGVFTFNLGTTYKGNDIVTQAIGARIPITLLIAVIALLIAILIAIPIGIISALKRNTWLDITLMIIALIGLSIPNFWQGLLFILAFSLKLDIFPPSYIPENPLSLILPVLVIGTAMAASITRMTRSSVLEVMRNDYVMTAYAKGLSTTQVVIRHIFKNAIIPIITLIGLLVAELLGGSAVTEQVFNINGIGRYIVQKQFVPDIPAVMGGVVYISLVISLVNLAIDIFYAIVDPKLREEIKGRE